MDVSQRMRRVRRSDTSIELRIRELLKGAGISFVVYAELPGTPDIVIPRHKIAIFVHGCFWHGHYCKLGHLPKTNISFWKDKLERNRLRDKRKASALRELGWRVITIWQCQTKKAGFDRSLQRKLSRLAIKG